MKTIEEIQKLEKRKEMAVFQRKITTQIWTVFEYDQEIDAIDRRLEQLLYKLKSEQKSSLNVELSVSVCVCEMPAKIKGKNECWRCKKPFKEFLQTNY